MAMKKIERSLYLEHGYYLVSTEKLGTDRRLDWIAVKELSLAERILHGYRPSSLEYDYIHNTLRALRQDVAEGVAESVS